MAGIDKETHCQHSWACKCTANAGQDAGCDFAEQRCEAGAVCVQHRRGADGSCMRATARYVASHSNRLACKARQLSGALGTWHVSRASTAIRLQVALHGRGCRAPDPVYTCVRMHLADMATHGQGCDADGAGQWVETGEADTWERERGWPPDAMWTESNWPAGQPSFVLFQVGTACVHCPRCCAIQTSACACCAP